MRKFLLVFIFSVFASNVLATGAWQSCNGTGPLGSAASVCQDLVKQAGESYEFSHMESQDETTATCYAKYKGSSGSPDIVGSACKIDAGIPGEGEGNPIEFPVSLPSSSGGSSGELQKPSKSSASKAPPVASDEFKKMLKDENALTYLANQIKGLGQKGGATVEIAQATLPNGESIFVAGINSSANWSKAQIDELKRLGIRVAPKTASGMTRADGGAPHAEENISSYLRDNRAAGVRWSRAVVGKEGSYVCRACKNVIKSSGGYIEPGFRGNRY